MVEVGDRLSHSCITRTRGSVVIEKRACEQRIRWMTPAAMLAVRLSDLALEQAAEAAPHASYSVPADRAVRDLRLSSLLYALERERLNGFPSGRLFLDGSGTPQCIRAA
jgi:AraC family transcriptional regulator